MNDKLYTIDYEKLGFTKPQVDYIKLLCNHSPNATIREHAIQDYPSLNNYVVEVVDKSKGCRKRLAPGQWWGYCGETDMGQTLPALCTECGGNYTLYLDK